MSCAFFLNLSWEVSFLYSSIETIVVPAPIIANLNINKKIATLISSEGILVYPVGAILTITVLITIQNDLDSPLEVLKLLLIRGSTGIIIGLLSTFLVCFILEKTYSVLKTELSALLLMSIMWATYYGSELVFSKSGLMGVVIFGIGVSSRYIPEKKAIIQFFKQESILFVSTLGILISASFDAYRVFEIGWNGVIIVLILMMLIRPLKVWLCTLGGKFSWEEKLFIGLIGPKGIVGASTSSIYSLIITKSGFQGGEEMQALIFLSIIITNVVQGLTAPKLAKLLQVTQAEQDNST